MENLTVLIPYRNGAATIERLLDCLPYELPTIIVDDVSNEPYQTNKNVRVIRLDQRGYFSGAVNAGIAACDTDMLILNQDVWLEGTAWLDLIAENRDHYAVIGNGVMAHPAWKNGYVDGVAMFLSREAIQKIGVLNKEFYPLWGSTCEWQLRACRAGYSALPTRVPGLHHARGEADYGASIAQALKDEPDKRDLFIRTPPAISVIIAAHNYGKFLPDALASLLGGQSILGEMKPQTFQSFEVVLVDYGSTDDTAEVCDTLADGWKGIRAIHVPDEGTAEACNRGIEAARGRYIAMLDADDMMEAERLEMMYRAAEQNPHRVIYDDIRIVYLNTRSEHWNYPGYDFEQCLVKNTMHKGLLFPKQAWKNVGGYPKIMTNGREDWAFNIALGVRGWCGVHVPQPLYLARRAEHNRSNRNTNPLWHQKFMEQLHLLYPKIFAGERPMGCCPGNRKHARGIPRGAYTPSKPLGVGKTNGKLPGADGMVLLEYTAPDYADLRCFYGKATDTPYWFGKLRKRGYVDARDANAFLEFMMGRAFEIVAPPPMTVQVNSDA